MNKILLVFLFCVTTGHHYPFLPHYSLIILVMPPHRTLLLQQATPSQFQPQPHGSSRPCPPSQSHSHCRQAAIVNVPESGKEFDFSSVEHKDNSTVCSNVATVNSTPSPSVQAQPVDLPACKSTSRNAMDINHFFLEGNAADQHSVMTLR